MCLLSFMHQVSWHDFWEVTLAVMYICMSCLACMVPSEPVAHLHDNFDTVVCQYTRGIFGMSVGLSFIPFLGGESLLSELRNKAMTEQSTVPSKRGKHGNSWRLPICTFQDIRYQIRFGSMVKCRDGKFEFIGKLYISREMKFCHRKQNADKVFLTRTKSSISTAS